MSEKINVNIIRAFEGPRHAKLERIWAWYAKAFEDEMNLHIFDNLGCPLRHDQALLSIWREEKERPERYTIFTEFDFLPGGAFLKVRPTDRPALAAEYCTRNPHTKQLLRHSRPGAWFIIVDKKRRDDPRLEAGGPHNDPANLLEANLLKTRDCYAASGLGIYSRHYGVQVEADEGIVGTHLFWSRHYNDPPWQDVAGFRLREVHDSVDRAIETYVKEEL